MIYYKSQRAYDQNVSISFHIISSVANLTSKNPGLGSSGVGLANILATWQIFNPSTRHAGGEPRADHYKWGNGAPISRVCSIPITHLFQTIYRGYNSIYNDRLRRPSLWWCTIFLKLIIPIHQLHIPESFQTPRFSPKNLSTVTSMTPYIHAFLGCVGTSSNFKSMHMFDTWFFSHRWCRPSWLSDASDFAHRTWHRPRFWQSDLTWIYLELIPIQKKTWVSLIMFLIQYLLLWRFVWFQIHISHFSVAVPPPFDNTTSQRRWHHLHLLSLLSLRIEAAKNVSIQGFKGVWRRLRRPFWVSIRGKFPPGGGGVENVSLMCIHVPLTMESSRCIVMLSQPLTVRED